MEKNDLPESWEFVSLSTIAKINPQKPPKDELSDDTLVSFVPMKSVEELTGKIDLNETRKCGEVRKGYTYFKNNDILFAKITPCMENGKIAIVEKLENSIGFGSTEFHVIRLKDKIDSKFYFHYLIQDDFRNKAQHKMKGTAGQLRVSSDYLKNEFIPLPPLNEQKRIVERIEELFSRIDSISKIFDKKKSLLRNYQKSILENALNGNLSSSWRKNNLTQLESPETLLGAVQTINDSKIKKSSLSNQKLPNLPQNWIWVKLGDVSTKIVDGAHYRPTYTTNGVPFLSVKDVRNRKVYFDNCKFISNEEHQKLFKRCNPEYGDVLFVKTGATIGRTSVIDTQNEFSLFVSVALVKPKKDFINSKYLSYVLEDHVNHMNINLSLKGVAIKNYHLEDMRLIDFPLTDVLEQNEIVKTIEYYFSLIMYLDKQIDQIFKFCQRLKSSILKQAFEGKLVPQDPNDEPASELLKRVKNQ